MNPSPTSSSENTPSADSLTTAFQNPGAAFRGKPFWSWNGTLTEAELLRQLPIFKEMGMGGAFMHSRTGLKTEYLGDEWFRLINACADECEKLGLEAWLYDEDRWPSGTAGGIATENPAYRTRALALSILEPEQVCWPSPETFVAAFTAEVDGLNMQSYQPLAYGAAAGEASGKVLIFAITPTREHSFYNGTAYLDTLNREATGRFLEATHEKYRKFCGDRLGKSIKGIFTDEPHHGLVMCHNDEQRTKDNPDWNVPYTGKLFEAFEKRWGYDLRARLPEVFLWPQGRRVSQVKWHYMETIQELFLENWAKPCREWCREHHLLLTGHVLHEDSLVAQAVPCGSVMRYYEHMDYPGVDLLGNSNHSYWVAKQLQSAARQFGKKWLLSELYGCAGWQFDFANHKETGFWQALFGINLRCHHLSWVTMAGEAKRDYPASISFQSTWYSEYKIVEDYFSRLHVVLQQGEPVCDVLILNPVESVWAQIHPGWAQWLGAKDPSLRALEEKYENLFHWLAGAQVDFDYGDEDHLGRFGKIETEAGTPRLRLGQCSYRVVVVAGMETMRSTSLKLVADFHAAGGKVLFIGTPPAYLDALASEEPARLAAKATALAHRREEVVAAVKAHSESPVGVQCDTQDIFCQIRREGSRLIAVAINTSSKASYSDVRFTAVGTGKVQEWDCDSGARYRHPSRLQQGAVHWACDFPPLGTRVFVVSESDLEELPSRPEFVPAASSVAQGPFHYRLSEPNLCVLDFASHRVGAGEWQPEQEILQVDVSVREALGIPQRSGMMMQPWAASKQGRNQNVRPSPVALRFEFDVETVPTSPVDLVLEMPDCFEIQCNGRAVEIPRETAWIIDPCLRRIPLPAGAIQPGTNRIELATAFTPEIDLEAIYLAGDFGVSLGCQRPALVALPATLQPCDVVSQGLPFYSGTISYAIPLPGPTDSGTMLRLETGVFGGALAKVRFEGLPDSAVPIAWAPYHADLACPAGATSVWCDVVLTRINTFGPLHMTPKEQNGIGPDSFRTRGDNFTRTPQLWPAGLLKPPGIKTSR